MGEPAKKTRKEREQEAKERRWCNEVLALIWAKTNYVQFHKKKPKGGLTAEAIAEAWGFPTGTFNRWQPTGELPPLTKIPGQRDQLRRHAGLAMLEMALASGATHEQLEVELGKTPGRGWLRSALREKQLSLPDYGEVMAMIGPHGQFLDVMSRYDDDVGSDFQNKLRAEISSVKPLCDLQQKERAYMLGISQSYVSHIIRSMKPARRWVASRIMSLKHVFMYHEAVGTAAEIRERVFDELHYDYLSSSRRTGKLRMFKGRLELDPADDHRPPLPPPVPETYHLNAGIWAYHPDRDLDQLTAERPWEFQSKEHARRAFDAVVAVLNSHVTRNSE